MPRALLLNADYTPLHFVSDIDAITLFYKGTAEVVHGLDGEPAVWKGPDGEPLVFRSPSTAIAVPATMRLLHRVHKKWKPPRFRKRVLFNRDGWKCQYCGVRLHANSVELEHVLPSSRGGRTSWLNCVASCHACNKRKANRTPEEAGMPLLRRPATPTALHFWDAMKSDHWHDSWESYIPKEV